MDYSKISKEGIQLLKVVIDNDENNIKTSPEKVKELLDKFTILSDATERVAVQNERENKAFQELLKRTSLLIIKLQNEKANLLEVIKENKRSIDVNEETKQNALKELNEIKKRIAETQKEIEKLKPKIEFQWWWIFCWWCGLAVAGIQNEINSKIALIEKDSLKADLLESRVINKNIEEFNKAIQKLEKKLSTDQVVLDKLKVEQTGLEKKAKLFASKTASTLHLNTEIKLIKAALKGLYNSKEKIYMLKARLNSKLDFCNGETSAYLPMHKILSDWGIILNEELTPTGGSVQAVRLAIDGKEFGHFRKLSESDWELVKTSNFSTYKDRNIAKILSSGKFRETHRDQWSIYLENDSQYIAVDIWKKVLTATNKKSRAIFTSKIIEGSLAEKVLFYAKDYITPNEVEAMCKEKNWRLASEFEVSIAWIHNGLNIFAFGQMRDNLVAVPIQSDINTFKKGLNIMPFNSKGSGNQGFFYIENKVLAFRKLIA